jgi:hypothetical protein
MYWIAVFPKNEIIVLLTRNEHIPGAPTNRRKPELHSSHPSIGRRNPTTFTATAKLDWVKRVKRTSSSREGIAILISGENGTTEGNGHIQKKSHLITGGSTREVPQSTLFDPMKNRLYLLKKKRIGLPNGLLRFENTGSEN